ncbi:MAG TPA: GNAT family N-acetyltransferase [Pyrinomonadaceae bacterium]|nr:GNAT family N-acetyltransferase [Pyrinomonadaceae bacterium]
MSSVKNAPTRLEGPAATVDGQVGRAAPASSLSVESLTNESRMEVLAFLAERPLHTVVMAGHIRDNGIESPLNRGKFYACRNGEGQLEGVALLGHATLVEARSEAALAAFARLAQSCPDGHMIMGEQEKVERFWSYYARVGQSPRRICGELLFEQRWPVEALEPVPALRLATLADLQEVMLIQGEMALAESGVNPLEVDLAGFSARCARRIEQGRVWVWAETDGRVIFKADIISDTPEAIYLEGIYVNPRERQRGYGSRCMSQLSRNLLQHAQSLCLLVNEQNQRARAFFERVGYKLRSRYDTVFLEGKV